MPLASPRSIGRVVRWCTAGLALVGAGLAVTFALPVPEWRTGERWTADLPSVSRAAMPAPARRIWIDTDAACGAGPTTDPDDCLAILYLAGRSDIDIAGISTVFGNAPLAVTDRTARDIARLLERQSDRAFPVYRGAATASSPDPTDATQGLIDALAVEPLTVVALGPLTNVAAVLAARPELRDNIERIVAVMGRREGHVFHPSEGSGGGMLLGHGPIFRDLNVAKDPEAVDSLLASGVHTVLVPYEAARQIEIVASDLDVLAKAGPASRQVADSARPWLQFWNDDIGRAGFYPFDLLAAHFAVAPADFACADATARVERDDTVSFPFSRQPALLVAPAPDDKAAAGRARLLYCHGLRGTADTFRKIWPAREPGRGIS